MERSDAQSRLTRLVDEVVNLGRDDVNNLGIDQKQFNKAKARIGKPDGPLFMPEGEAVRTVGEQLDPSRVAPSGVTPENNAHYLSAVKAGAAETAQRMVDEAAALVREPTKTLKTYKIFRTLKSRPKELFPLFIGKNKSTPIGEWIPAEFVPTKGFASRPGWHSGRLPHAPHLMKMKDAQGNKIPVAERTEMQPDRVWAEVEIPADVDWQPKADMAKTRDVQGEVPAEGFYRFNRPDVQGLEWIISGALKVNRILTNKEAREIASKGEVPVIEKVKHPAVVKDKGGRVIPLGDRFRFLPELVGQTEVRKTSDGYKLLTRGNKTRVYSPTGKLIGVASSEKVADNIHRRHRNVGENNLRKRPSRRLVGR